MSPAFLLLFALVFGLVILILVNQPKRRYNPKNQVSKIKPEKVKEKWLEIEGTFSLGGPSHFKAAITEADKLIDSVLINKRVLGNTFGERLKNAKKLFRNYNDYNNLWFAHKVRNEIAHNINHELNSAEAKRAMEYYKKALKELKVI